MARNLTQRILIIVTVIAAIITTGSTQSYSDYPYPQSNGYEDTMSSDMNYNMNSNMGSDMNSNMGSDMNSNMGSDMNSNMGSKMNSNMNSNDTNNQTTSGGGNLDAEGHQVSRGIVSFVLPIFWPLSISIYKIINFLLVHLAGQRLPCTIWSFVPAQVACTPVDASN